MKKASRGYQDVEAQGLGREGKGAGLVWSGDVEVEEGLTTAYNSWRGSYRDNKAQLSSSAWTPQHGAMSTNPWRVMFDRRKDFPGE